MKSLINISNENSLININENSLILVMKTKVLVTLEWWDHSLSAARKSGYQWWSCNCWLALSCRLCSWSHQWIAANLHHSNDEPLSLGWTCSSTESTHWVLFSQPENVKQACSKTYLLALIQIVTKNKDLMS